MNGMYDIFFIYITQTCMLKSTWFHIQSICCFHVIQAVCGLVVAIVRRKRSEGWRRWYHHVLCRRLQPSQDLLQSFYYNLPSIKYLSNLSKHIQMSVGMHAICVCPNARMAMCLCTHAMDVHLHFWSIISVMFLFLNLSHGSLVNTFCHVVIFSHPSIMFLFLNHENLLSLKLRALIIDNGSW